MCTIKLNTVFIKSVYLFKLIKVKIKNNVFSSILKKCDEQ